MNNRKHTTLKFVHSVTSFTQTQANDVAHKAMLRDLIPMVSLRGKHTEKELSDFKAK